MSGSTPLIDHLDFSSSQKEVIANRVNDAEAPAAVFGIKTLVGLTLTLYGGAINVSGVPTILANQTVTLTDNATNYVKASSAGVVSVVTSPPSGWPGPLASNVTALYSIVTVGGVYTSYIEYRIAGVTAAASVSNPVFIGDSGGSPSTSVAGLVPAATSGDAANKKALLASGAFGYPGGIIQIACSDQTTALSVGGSPTLPAMTFRAPFAFSIGSVRASLAQASTSGLVTIDIKVGGTSIFSTLLTIDANELTSTTAATPAVISNPAVADDANIQIYVTVAGTAAIGLMVTIYPS